MSDTKAHFMTIYTKVQKDMVYDLCNLLLDTGQLDKFNSLTKSVHLDTKRLQSRTCLLYYRDTATSQGLLQAWVTQKMTTEVM